jgi:hypothetical protein
MFRRGNALVGPIVLSREAAHHDSPGRSAAEAWVIGSHPNPRSPASSSSFPLQSSPPMFDRGNTNNLEIRGTIQNNGKTTWESIEIAVDFFSPDGKFLDEETGRVSSSVKPGDVEHFKITILNPSERIQKDDVRKELKIANASSRIF